MYEFKKGIPEGCELIAHNVFNNWKAASEAFLGGHKYEIDFKHCTCEVLASMCGGVMWTEKAKLELGTVGKFFAVRNVKSGHESVFLCGDVVLEDENYRKLGRTSWNEPIRGGEYRKAIETAANNGTDFHKWNVNDIIALVDHHFCQVNDMKDLMQQYDTYDKPNDTIICKVEGITEMTDEEVMQYDYFNDKPEGHEGGGYGFDDEGDFEYDDDWPLSGSVTIVWLLRSPNYCIAVDCEGHSYSEYLYLPVGMVDEIRKYVDGLPLSDYELELDELETA